MQRVININTYKNAKKMYKEVDTILKALSEMILFLEKFQSKEYNTPIKILLDEINEATILLKIRHSHYKEIISGKNN